MFQSLSDAKRVFDILQIPLQLHAGTALGALREQNFILHDLDIDICVSELIDMELLINEMENSNFFKKTELYKWKGRITECSFIHLSSSTSFDVFVLFKEDLKHHFIVLWNRGDGNEREPLLLRYNNFNVNPINFLDVSVLCPDEVYIAQEYGLDWKIPKDWSKLGGYYGTLNKEFRPSLKSEEESVRILKKKIGKEQSIIKRKVNAKVSQKTLIFKHNRRPKQVRLTETKVALKTNIFIILLKSDELRVRHVEDVLIPSLKKNNITVHVVPAVEGKSYDVEYYTTKYNIKFSKLYLETCKRGQMACTLSHIKVWLKAREAGFDQFIVLEDDAIVTETFTRGLNQTIDDLSDTNYDFSYLYTPKMQLRNDNQVLIPQKTHINKGYEQWCTTAYIASKKGVLNLLQHFKVVSGNTDVMFCELLESTTMMVFSCKDPIISSIGQLESIHKGEKLPSNIWNSDPFTNRCTDEKVKIIHINVTKQEDENENISTIITKYFTNYQLKIWKIDQMENIIRSKFPGIFSSIFCKKGHYKDKLVVSKCCLMYIFGGIYLDFNHIASYNLINLDNILSSGDLVIEDDNTVSDILLASGHVKHPFWLDLLTEIETMLNEKNKLSNNPISDVVLRKKLLSKYMESVQLLVVNNTKQTLNRKLL